MKKHTLLMTTIIGVSAWSGCQLTEAKNEDKPNKTVLSSEKLTGKWIQTSTKIANDQEGYIFKENGMVEDINHTNYKTENWTLSEDTLTLSIKSHEIAVEDTLTVTYKANIDNNVLILSSFDPESSYQEIYIKAE